MTLSEGLANLFTPCVTGVWAFHCHVAWHISEGMNINILEQPAGIEKEMELPYVMAQTCRDWADWTGGHGEYFGRDAICELILTECCSGASDRLWLVSWSTNRLRTLLSLTSTSIFPIFNVNLHLNDRPQSHSAIALESASEGSIHLLNETTFIVSSSLRI